MPAHQPVGAGITQQGVVAAVAVGVPDAFLGQIDDFSGGEAGDIGALPIFGLGGGAADAAAESIAHRVGDEAGGLGFLGLAVLGEAAAGQDFVAPVDQAGLERGAEADGGDAEFVQGLEFAGVGDAVVVGVLPDFDGVPGGVGGGELIVGVAVEGFEGREAVGVGVLPASPSVPGCR